MHDSKGLQGSFIHRHPPFDVVIMIAGLVWVENLGYKATTILAGLGVGGIAVALAAQKSIENLIGAITIYISAPVKTGDFCCLDGRLGFIEEIGLRYTKVRTLDRSLVNIANSIFVDMKIENLTHRDKIRYHPKIQFSRKTTLEQIRYNLEEIRKMLLSHSMVDPVPARVRFTEIGDVSYNIDILAYIKTMSNSEYLEIAEELNLQIMEIVEKSGATLLVKYPFNP